MLNTSPKRKRGRGLWGPYADNWKRQKIDDIVLMLQGAMAAEGKVGLMMNVPRERLSSVLALLPALQKPIVSSLSDDEWGDVNTGDQW